MNAQEIKNILIAYLRATNREIRIYQEKSIGDAVCDLMAVTDCLTGYEVKSDLDNYQRLGRQIKAYDRFFEQCYIVVGCRHLQSAERKVPGNWGIITIQSDHVIVNRPAHAGNPDCASQLGALWKLELTNLLIKTGLPLYTYSEAFGGAGSHISDRELAHPQSPGSTSPAYCPSACSGQSSHRWLCSVGYRDRYGNTRIRSPHGGSPQPVPPAALPYCSR